jgi:hypothetical protein
MLASFPVVNLDNPTRLAFQVSWLLATLANFLVYIVLLVVFALGMMVRLPGARRDIAAVEQEWLARETVES